MASDRRRSDMLRGVARYSERIGAGKTARWKERDALMGARRRGERMCDEAEGCWFLEVRGTVGIREPARLGR